jgi:hypothetical protein
VTQSRQIDFCMQQIMQNTMSWDLPIFVIAGKLKSMLEALDVSMSLDHACRKVVSYVNRG